MLGDLFKAPLNSKIYNRANGDVTTCTGIMSGLPHDGRNRVNYSVSLKVVSHRIRKIITKISDEKNGGKTVQID